MDARDKWHALKEENKKKVSNFNEIFIFIEIVFLTRSRHEIEMLRIIAK